MIKYKGTYPDSVERGNGSQFRLREEGEEERHVQKMRGRQPVEPKVDMYQEIELQVLVGEAQ